MKYPIKTQLIPFGTKRSSGLPIEKVRFIVCHDTGNPRSTAQNNVDYYIRSCNEQSASAHLFVDDKEIIECIPAFKNPRKAWHVLYQKPKDNELFGDDANDAAIGVELCYGDNINAEESYKRYIWVIAYLLHYHGLTPDKIVSHHILDPERKTDPDSALKTMGKTYAQLVEDIRKEYESIDANGDPIASKPPISAKPSIPVSKPAPAPAPTRNPLPDGVLKRGDQGEAVKELQRALNALNFKCGAVDGIYGAATEDAVLRFQKMYGIQPYDGIYGAKTRAVMAEKLR